MRLVRTLVTLSIVSGLGLAPLSASTSASDQAAGSIVVNQRGPNGIVLGGCYEVWSAPAAGSESFRGTVCDRWDGSFNGAVHITGLEDGRYRLHEYEAPSAYRLTPHDVIATVVDGDEVSVTRDHEIAPVLAVEAVNAAGDLVPGSCWIVVNPGQTEGGWERCDKQDGADDGVTHFLDRAPAPYELVHEVTPFDYERVEALTPFEMLDEDTTVTVTLTVLPPVNVELPTVGLDPARGVTLPSSPGTWSGTNPSFSYQWERCNAQGSECVAIVGATGTEYLVTDADSWKSIRLAVTASNAAGTSTARSAPGRLVQGPQPPVLDPARPPKVIGYPWFGYQLQVDEGGWSGTSPMSSTVQWQRCNGAGVCTDVPGATGAMYTVTNADWLYNVRFRLTRTNVDGTTSAFSWTSGRVENLAPSPADPNFKPWIDGSLITGTELIAKPGQWTGRANMTFTYRWFRCVETANNCSEMTGVTGDRYPLTAADIGFKFRFQVNVVNSDGNGTLMSKLSAKIQGNPPKPDPLSKPYQLGVAYPGGSIQAIPGGWLGHPVLQYFYSWQRCDAEMCVDIPGAFGPAQYVVTTADIGYRIRFVVTARNSDGVGSAASPKSAIVKSNPPKLDFNQGPSVVGRTVVGSELRVVPGVWSGVMPMTFEYQWVRSSVSAAIWQPIAGATADRYVLTAADIGFDIKVELRAVNADGSQAIRVHAHSVVTAS